MRWVSMVPSWTETLLECGAHVVGRTRYCVHPAAQVANIPAIGGTKEMNLEQLLRLQPDLLLLDREENPRAMADVATVSTHASHVRQITDLPRELHELARMAGRASEPELEQNLERIAERWSRVIATSKMVANSSATMQATANSKANEFALTWAELPGVISWLTPPPPGIISDASERKKIAYVIWKNPWMCAADGTFIASVLHALGMRREQIFSPRLQNLYPSFEFADLPRGSVILFSSEPYPFLKKQRELMDEVRDQACAQSLSLALVDGESFSWFGIRSLRFLERVFRL